MLWWSELPRIEGKLWPVNVDTDLQAVKENGHWSVRIDFRKQRDCTYKDMGVYWAPKNAGLQRLPAHQTLIDNAVDMPTDHSRPRGPNTLRYEITTQTAPDEWQIHVTHSCHPFWSTRSRMWP
jgi:hypothetical protein